MNNLLIVEDECGLRDEITEILEFEGFNVYHASNGADGVKKAIFFSPDLILCDIMMPGMNGFDVLKALKRNAKTALIPFVFITAMDEQKNFRKGMELGADDYLIKPFSRKDLLNTIRTRNTKNEIIQKKIDGLRDKVILSIPHEMKTPLVSILGFGEILQDPASKLSAAEIMDIGTSIVESGIRLDEIVNKYLTYIDFLTAKDNEISVVRITSDYIQKIVQEVAQKHNRINDYTIQTNEFYLKLKEKWLRFIIRELVDNAFKFSNLGQEVIIKSWKTDNSIQLVFEDNGIGFSEENCNEVNAFEQFNRIKHEQQGIGVALFLIKEMINKYSGRLTIKCKKSKGCLVCVEFPRVTK